MFMPSSFQESGVYTEWCKENKNVYLRAPTVVSLAEVTYWWERSEEMIGSSEQDGYSNSDQHSLPPWWTEKHLRTSNASNLEAAWLHACGYQSCQPTTRIWSDLTQDRHSVMVYIEINIEFWTWRYGQVFILILVFWVPLFRSPFLNLGLFLKL